MKVCPRCGATHQKIGTYCSRACANSRTWSTAHKNKLKKKMSGYHFGNAVESPDKMTTSTCKCGVEFTHYKSINRKFCSRKCQIKWFDRTNLGGPRPGFGGVQPNAGSSKHGMYKGYRCDSSYELVWVIYHLDHNIPFKRNVDGYEYSFNGRLYKYYPDFIKDDVYYELKGFARPKDYAKWSAFPYELKVMKKRDMVDMFEYVITKYGKNFVRLYE